MINKLVEVYPSGYRHGEVYTLHYQAGTTMEEIRPITIDAKNLIDDVDIREALTQIVKIYSPERVYLTCLILELAQGEKVPPP